MSWDIFVMSLPAGIRSIADIPDDYVGPPLGRRSDIIAKILALYPACDFTDPSWGTLDLGDCAIEFSLGTSEQVQSFALHVRGGPPAPDIVAHTLAELGMRALDPSSDTGLFEHAPAARSASSDRWRAFRSHVAASLNGRG
jgi:hypothetical protein